MPDIEVQLMLGVVLVDAAEDETALTAVDGG